MDILKRRDAQPVPPDIHEQLVEPFIAAARMTLSELAQTELAVRTTYRTATPRTFGDISALLGLTVEGGEMLVLSFPAQTATALAGRVLAEVIPEPADDLVRDCMGEVANVIAGQAKTMLAETPYQLVLATPSIVSGSDIEIGACPGIEGLVVVFGSDAGDFSLQVCLQWHGPNATSPAVARDERAGFPSR